MWKKVLKGAGLSTLGVGALAGFKAAEPISLIITYIFIIVFVLLVYYLATSKRFKEFLGTIKNLFF